MSTLIPNSEIHRIEVVKSNDEDNDRCSTFILHNEDHTLGNSLRYIIMNDPDVDFCGYSVPHPSENKINLRIQTRSKPAYGVLKKGLTELQNECNHALETFQKAVQEFKERKQPDEEMKTD